MSHYIDLHNHSTYSMLDGMGTPKGIVERAKALGWGAAAITEHGWLGSAPSFYRACIEGGIKPILGCEFYIVPDEDLGQKGKEFRYASSHLTVLALSKEGYQNLVVWSTLSMQPENFYYKPRISLAEMVESAVWPLHHNVILTGCLGSELSKTLSQGPNIEAGISYLGSLRAVFPNLFVEIQNHRIEKFADVGYTAYDELLEKERKLRPALVHLAAVSEIPLCLTNDSHYQHPSQRKSHVAMRASAWRHRDDSHYGRSTEQLAASYLKDYAYFGSYLRDMERVCGEIPFEALESIDRIVDEANIRLSPLDNFNYSIPFSGYDDPVARIRRRAKPRLEKLVQKHGRDAKRRFEHELESMVDFAHYLLLMSDFIRAARKQGILTNTRGSAANSLLCYCIGIHDVDSIEYGLTFSRFFNPARKKLPDIDIDIEKDRYEDFMKIVKERMDVLEGEGQVVQICNYGTQANRSAFRAAASALGVPKETQDEITKLLPQMIDSGMIEEETDAYAILKVEYPDLYEIASEIFDSVRSVGQHACGWIMGTGERPLESWIPLYLIASSGKLVTQYDLKSLEDFGLVKGDFLRLRTLSVVKRTLNLLGKDSLGLENIPLDDPATFEMLRKGKTEGIFTLQGKENRRGVVATEVGSVHDVIASVALYRPALTRTGLHAKYNDRRTGRERVDYPHDIAEEILGETYGIPLFQEQAMEIGYAVGLGDEEVDEIYQAIKLSKGVGRHAKAAFKKIEPAFFKAALKIMSEEEAEGVWEQVKAFQGYGFNKGHATSYGILAVRAAYLRCHHPAEFFTALLDVYPEKHKYIAEARTEGFSFLPPSIGRSGRGFSFDKGASAIRVGLGRIKGLGTVSVDEIVSKRPFRDFEDFHDRTTRRVLNRSRVEILAKIGAFSDFGIKGDATDADEFEILGFCLGKPKAFRGIKPKHVSARVSDSGWNHLGREKGIEISEPRTSVSKLFWIPPNAKLELKASPWAQVKTWLLTVVDENGVPFHIMANEDREWHVKTLKFLQRKCQDGVVCLDGSIRFPFLNDGPQGFRLFGITGSFNNEPQVWIDGNKDFTKTFVALDEMQRRNRAVAKA